MSDYNPVPSELLNFTALSSENLLLKPPGSQLIKTLEGREEEVCAVEVTPNSKFAISASGNRTLKI